MITKEKFIEIKERYGDCASWAIWANPGEKPKSNVGNLNVIDPNKNPNLLKKLNPNIVMVSLNISRRIERPFANFHDSRPVAMDYKIRYAFNDSIYCGAYMTDIIKDFEQKISGDVMKYLNKNPDFEKANVKSFIEELNFVGAKNPLIIAFGNDVFDILNRNLKDKFPDIKKVPHYSHHIKKEDYAKQVLKLLSD